ncbi:MAG: ATP synthase F1 subunit gamma [Oscillospiraceae bacterium]
MQNISDIRHHINAVAETRKITGAMQMVASSHMKKVMSHIEYNQKYFVRLQSTMKGILESSQETVHPYLQSRGKDRRTYIVIAGDKGMAGSYNTNLLHFAHAELAAHPGSYLIAVGLKTHQFFRRNGIIPDLEIENYAQDPSLANARALAYHLMSLFDAGQTDGVYIIFTIFSGSVKNTPVVRHLLPLLVGDFDQFQTHALEQDVFYLPSPQEAFDSLVPQYIVSRIFAAFAQAYASEHFARMNAMQSASRNADELLKRLKMQYNMARQAAITQEISEISGAVEALRKGDAAYATE